MSSPEVKITALDRMSPGSIAVSREATPDPAVSPWRKVHRKLRGRYHWAVLLAILGMAGGGYMGWNAREPLYQSQGLIYIEPSMSSPQDPEGRSVLPMFQGFVAGQVQLLLQSRTTELAMEMDPWVRTGEAGGPEAVESFARRRAILHVPQTQHIEVQFNDTRREVARAGVQALIEAYQKLAMEVNDADEGLEYARAQIETLNAKIQTTRRDILTHTEEYGGAEAMAVRHLAAVEQVLETERDRDRVRAEIAQKKSRGEDTATPREMTVGEIAIDSDRMDQSLLDLELLEAEAKLLSGKVTDTHDSMLALREQIRVRRERIERFAAEWNKARQNSSTQDGTSLGELVLAEERLTERLESLRTLSRKIGQTRADVERLTATREDYTTQLDLMERMRDQLENQLQGSGRIKIYNAGSLPVSYFSDPRNKFAVIGGFLGGALGLLIVLLLGLLDRRVKSVGDVGYDLSELRLLGLFPSIPVDLSDPRGGQMAIHCVHQIRTLLQIGYTREQPACICLTGAGVGTGKTTLSAALGLSFANSGTRTVLVDADLTGRGLTHRVSRMLWQRTRHALRDVGLDAGPTAESGGAGRTTGHLLAPLSPRLAGSERPDVAELVETLSAAVQELGLDGATKAGVVGDLFALGDLLYSGEARSQLTERLQSLAGRSGEQGSGGTVAAIPLRVLELESGRAEFNGSGLDRYLYPTGVEGLHFLPLRGMGQGGEVSVSAISKILARMREEFDVALVDTGPVRGTVETSMVAAQADCVVLVVSPGDQRPEAERAVAHLEEVGARLAGVVFNRAGQREVQRSSMSYYAGSTSES